MLLEFRHPWESRSPFQEQPFGAHGGRSHERRKKSAAVGMGIIYTVRLCCHPMFGTLATPSWAPKGIMLICARDRLDRASPRFSGECVLRP